jgi:hypothetical protein
MFSFRYASPKRKDHHATVSAAPITSPKLRGPLKLFGQNPPPPHQEARCDDSSDDISDDSSVNMSLYTTQSKSTIQYHGRHRRHTEDYESTSQAPTVFTTELDLMRHHSKLGGLAAKIEMQRTKVDVASSLLTPATDLMTHSEDELSLASSGYDLLQMRSTEKIIKMTSGFTFKEEAPLTTRSIQSTRVDSDEQHHVKRLFPSTHVDLDGQDNLNKSLRSTPSRHNRYFGPVDLDESIADSSSCTSSSNSWVKSPSGMASSAIYQKSSNYYDDADSSASSAEVQQPQPENSSVVSRAPVVKGEDDDSQDSPYHVWADHEGEEEEDKDDSGFLQQTRLQWSHDDEEVLSRTYQEAMSSISFAKRTQTPQRVLLGDSEEDDEKKVHSPGAVLLTQEELQHHLNQVQGAQPLPSSSIEGYDSWRRQKEYQARYFAILQEKAVERKKQKEKADRRSPPPSTRSNPSIDHRQQHEHCHRPQLQRRGIGDASNQWAIPLMDSTRSAMDQSMDSSIPTLAEASTKPRRRREQTPPRRRRWNVLSLFQSPKNKKKKKSSPSKKKKKGEQFLRRSVSDDEPSEVAEFPSAPLTKVGHVTLGSSLPGEDTMGATYSHHLDQYNSGPKQLPFRFSEEEFQKHCQAEMDKEREEQIEQERMAKLKQHELERQRQLNLRQEGPPRRRRARISSSDDERSEVAEFPSSPLTKVGHVTLGSPLPGGDTMGATYSHHLDQYNSEPKQLPFRFSEEEFQKHCQAEMDKEREEQIEQERMAKLKQHELERQRQLNLRQERPPRRRRATDSSFGQASTTKSHGSSARSKLHNKISSYPVQQLTSSSKDTASTGSPSEDSVLDRSISLSICSKQSFDSSLQSRSVTVLSPCVICNGAERTHIAMPCMHYSFCGTCVERLYEFEDPACPVCNTKNVAFTKVFTG